MGGGGDDIRQCYEVGKTGRQFCKTCLVKLHVVFVLQTSTLLSGRYRQETGTLRHLA